MEHEEEEYLYDISSEEIQMLPLAHHEGSVMLIENPEEVAAAVTAICRAARVGFDTESRPSFRRGEHYPVCLIQVATHECVYLFRINKTGLTPELREFLADEKVQKIGVGLGQDIRELQSVYGQVDCGGCVDLERIAQRNRFKKRGVRALAAHFLQVRISKSAQKSNWERETLTQKQITYAATDAWICLRIYEEMEKADYIVLDEEICCR